MHVYPGVNDSCRELGKLLWTTLVLVFSFMHAKLLQTCPALCDPMDCSPPGSSVHGILQKRILECVAISSSRDLLDPGIKLESHVSCIGGQVPISRAFLYWFPFLKQISSFSSAEMTS